MKPAFEFPSFIALLEQNMESVLSKTIPSDVLRLKAILNEHAYSLPLAMCMRPDRILSLYTAVYGDAPAAFQLNTVTSLFYSHLDSEMENTLLGHIERAIAIDGPDPQLSVIPLAFRQLCPASLTSAERGLAGSMSKKVTLRDFLRNNKMFVVIILLVLAYWLKPKAAQ